MSLFFQRKAGYDLTYGAKDPLFVNNFGYYTELTDPIRVSRPEGRDDFHLIYVSSGEIRVDSHRLQNGEYCIFAPKEPQFYTYLPKKSSRYYWVHFTGYRVSELLRNEALTPGLHGGNGRHSEADALFLSLLHATAQDPTQSSPYIVSLFYAILQLFAASAPKAYPFSRARHALEDLSTPTSVGALAALYRMTPEHFIRSFKGVYGTTPAAYRIHHQLSQAKNLLSDTQLSVAGIAELCGITDPYYFSRLFKKHVGVTPTQYRARAWRGDRGEML